jgi:hypothetical protein
VNFANGQTDKTLVPYRIALPATAGEVKPISGGAKVKHCGFGSLVKCFNVAYQVSPHSHFFPVAAK